MNGLFVTQSGYLQLFAVLEVVLRQRISLDCVGYYVSDRANYTRFTEQVCREWVQDRIILCEWNILEKARTLNQVDKETLKNLETRYADPTFWNVLLCDRRVFLGKRTVFTQDYKPRFGHEEMLNILIAGLEAIENHIQQVQPDFILSFINVTFGEYLYYLVARKLGIPYLNLRNTKVENFVTAAPDIFEPSKNVKVRYSNYDEKGIPEDTRSFAITFVSNLKRTRVTYEGQTYLDRAKQPSIMTVAAHLRQFARATAGWCFGRVFRPQLPPRDNHTPNPLVAAFFREVINPLRFQVVRQRFSSRFVTLADLSQTPFAFYPLHLEPEISLLTYSRPYLNQIEVIRWFALALPVGWKLVIKDHPKNPYYRSLGYYKTLFEIPNVLMTSHETSTFDIIHQARLVCTISGFVGFEALCQAKPVIGLGCSSYEFLPETMYRKTNDPKQIADELIDLLERHRHDQQALERFVASVVAESVRFDWYTIGKAMQSSTYTKPDEFLANSGYKDQFDILAQYLIKRLNFTSTSYNGRTLEVADDSIDAVQVDK